MDQQFKMWLLLVFLSFVCTSFAHAADEKQPSATTKQQANLSYDQFGRVVTTQTVKKISTQNAAPTTVTTMTFNQLGQEESRTETTQTPSQDQNKASANLNYNSYGQLSSKTSVTKSK